LNRNYLKGSAGPIKGEHRLLRRLELPIDQELLSRNVGDHPHQAYLSQPVTKRRMDARSYRSVNPPLLHQSILDATSDASVERLMSFNETMKKQIAGIISTLEGKIHRAKQRKMVEIAQDPNYLVVKGKQLAIP
jgi:hypothetical protein